ncbi:MAG TPA: WXG100 family type VII secretion target [Amycolatopsis sp.]|uniref:WXG100 family type VII secretion target n=1 Tax=Amycolatopsis sp. TaxID=37632 RepID=UPI002B474A06|nr:WXG100 family type VII secretion target [Amycolatopsis sp.]HKS47771.1 WXG100 family type VII secretion target [Amycolatopsis sp.]
MDQLTVDFSALDEAANALDKHVDEATALLDEVEGHVRQLESSWSGAAQAAFRAAFDEWRSAVRDLHDEARTIRDFVVTAHGNHAGAVHTNVRIWRV